MNAIYISRIHYPVTTLGPGRRVGIWFQGCSIRCPGCLSVDTWAVDHGRTFIEDIMEAIDVWIDSADGVTISGGEPFDQPDALLVLLRQIRKRFSGDILVYSGYQHDKLITSLKDADGTIDALISGPFDYTASHTLPLRGSDNQCLHTLTPLGQQRFIEYDQPQSEQSGSLDVMFDEDGTVWFAGIPRRDDFTRLQKMLEKDGHRVSTSEHKLRYRNN